MSKKNLLCKRMIIFYGILQPGLLIKMLVDDLYTRTVQKRLSFLSHSQYEYPRRSSKLPCGLKSFFNICSASFVNKDATIADTDFSCPHHRCRSNGYGGTTHIRVRNVQDSLSQRIYAQCLFSERIFFPRVVELFIVRH